MVCLPAGGPTFPGADAQVTALRPQLLVFTGGWHAAQDHPHIRHLQKGEHMSVHPFKQMSDCVYECCAHSTIAFRYLNHLLISMKCLFLLSQVLTMNSAAQRLATSGEIINLISVDCQRIQTIMGFLPYALTTPLQVKIMQKLYFRKVGLIDNNILVPRV